MTDSKPSGPADGCAGCTIGSRREFLLDALRASAAALVAIGIGAQTEPRRCRCAMDLGAGVEGRGEDVSRPRHRRRADRQGQRGHSRAERQVGVRVRARLPAPEHRAAVGCRRPPLPVPQAQVEVPRRRHLHRGPRDAQHGPLRGEARRQPTSSSTSTSSIRKTRTTPSGSTPSSRCHNATFTTARMSCQDCLSRREFLTRSTLAVAGAAAVVAGCGDGQIGAGGATAPILTDAADLQGLRGSGTRDRRPARLRANRESHRGQAHRAGHLPRAVDDVHARRRR